MITLFKETLTLNMVNFAMRCSKSVTHTHTHTQSTYKMIDDPVIDLAIKLTTSVSKISIGKV